MIIVLLVCAALLFLFACEKKNTGYTSISPEEAEKMMEEDCVILDVRTEEEFNELHIPDAVNIPVESIGNTRPLELPRTDQVILVYCRTGVRAKQAAQKLADLGYTKVYEFGGIVSWKGDTVKEHEFRWDAKAALTLDIHGQQVSTNVITEGQVLEALGTKSYEVSFREEGADRVGELPWTFTLEEEDTEVLPGDILIVNGKEMLIVLEEGTVKGCRIGKLIGWTKEELLDIVGEGDFTAGVFLDWLDY